MYKMKKVFFCIPMVLFFSLINYNPVVIAAEGSYISTDTTEGNGGGGPGGSGEGSKASWFYYKYQDNKYGESVMFLPIAFNVPDIGSAVTINGACAKKDGGFWHFGRTDGKSGTLDCNFRDGGPGCDHGNDFFRMSVGSYYHSQTINKNTRNSYWAYVNPGASNIKHEIYKDWRLKYKATDSSSDPWGENGSNSKVAKAWEQACSVSGRSDCSKTLPPNVSYFCWWPDMEKKFEGKSTLSGAASATAGYTNSNTTKTGFIENCSATEGCKVSFSHQIKRSSGNNTTNYTVSRTANLTTTPNGRTIKVGTIKTGSSGNNNGETVSSNGPITLFPGMVVCEKLTFGTGSGTSTAYTQVCASALGNAQGNQTLLEMKVKNDDVPKYNNYQSSVYAKPDDSLTFKATYNPLLQYTYNLKPEQMKIDDGTIYPTSGKNTASTLENMFNSNKNKDKNKGRDLGNWKNSFSVQLSNDKFKNSKLIDNYGYTVGDISPQNPPENSHTVTQNDVGTEVKERAITNLNKDVKTTPSQVIFTQNGDNNLGNVITAEEEETASAPVPYNFTTFTQITTDKDTLFYAGEKQSVDFDFIVRPKENLVTEGTYVTKTDAEWQIRFCTTTSDAETCTPDITTSKGSGTLMPDDKSKEYNRPQKVTIGVPDVKAGSRVCLQSEIYPATSGDDKNIKPAGDGKWNISGIKCFTVAKKPSLQILGGNIYSAGNISTFTSIKGHLDGITVYDSDGDYGDKYVFGSWGELGLIANGAVTGFSSGASLAKNSEDSFGGKNREKIFARSPLSFPNSPSSDDTIGTGLGNAVNTNKAKTDKSAIIERFMYGEGSAERPQGVEYNHSKESISTPTFEIAPGTIKVIHSDGNIFVGGDIRYNSTLSVGSLSALPKLVLYADNIYIGCDVKRIDGVLIAEREVITCASEEGEEPGVDDRRRSNQLTINGAVIAGRLVPNRTYGAATGVNSGEPAEKINFDPTLYLWGGVTSEQDNNDENVNLNMGPVKEVAPRY